MLARLSRYCLSLWGSQAGCGMRQLVILRPQSENRKMSAGMPVSRSPFSTQIVQQLILGLPRKGAICSEAVFPPQCTKSRQSFRGVPWRPAPEMILGSVGLTVNTSQSPLHLCFLMRRPAFLTQPSNWKPLESTSLEWYTAFSLCSSPQLKTAEAVIRSGEKRNNNAPQVNKSSFLQGGMEQWFFIC